LLFPTSLFSVNTEALSGVKNPCIYAVERTNGQWWAFIGAPNLASGTYYGNRVKLQYDSWYYGALHDRGYTTGTTENWDALGTSHTPLKYSGTVQKHQYALNWSYNGDGSGIR